VDDLSSPLPGSDPSPACYRVLVLSTTDEVIRTERLPVTSDEEAITLAQAKVDGHSVELWDGLRFTERFDHTFRQEGGSTPSA
jgi:hypothetical protein